MKPKVGQMRTSFETSQLLPKPRVLKPKRRWNEVKQLQQQSQREQLKRVSLPPYGLLLASFDKIIIVWCESLI